MYWYFLEVGRFAVIIKLVTTQTVGALLHIRPIKSKYTFWTVIMVIGKCVTTAKKTFEPI